MNGFREIVCSIEGQTLYGYFQDNGSENNLVLIPGSYTHHSIWKPVTEKAGIDANIFLVELPGFGKSRPVTPDGTVEAFAAQILRWVEAAGINRFFVGGHSIGGMIAIEMTDLAGGRIDGVISCEGWTHASAQKEAFHGLKNETLTAEQIERNAYYGMIARTHWTEDEIKVYAGIWRKWEKGRELLERAAMPVLEIWGDRGMAERPSQDRLQIPCRGNIRLVWMRRCGHAMLVQCPGQIGKEIADFIGRVSRNGKNQVQQRSECALRL